MNHSSPSITIHNLDPMLYGKLKQRAEDTQSSLNKLIKSLLMQSLGMTKSAKVADFSAFSGRWNAGDLSEFEKTQASFSTVDLSDWR